LHLVSTFSREVGTIFEAPPLSLAETLCLCRRGPKPPFLLDSTFLGPQLPERLSFPETPSERGASQSDRATAFPQNEAAPKVRVPFRVVNSSSPLTVTCGKPLAQQCDSKGFDHPVSSEAGSCE